MKQKLSALLVQLRPEIDWIPVGPVESSKEIEDQGYAQFLKAHDGLSAFRGGLRIFGTQRSLLPSISEWNSPDLWKSEYRELERGITFFAEDFLGNQFGFEKQAVIRFLAETGDREAFSQDFEGWLQKIVADPVEELALWLLDDWHARHQGPNPGEHLCPKIPFVVKGQTEADNLYVCDRIESMRFKGSFAHQIRHLPTGGQVQMRVK
jgi:hypothetical protein